MMLLDWLAHGTWQLGFWQLVLFTLAMTYVFPAMVTYLPEVFFDQSVEMERDPNDESVVNPDFFKTN